MSKREPDELCQCYYGECDWCDDCNEWVADCPCRNRVTQITYY